MFQSQLFGALNSPIVLKRNILTGKFRLFLKWMLPTGLPCKWEVTVDIYVVRKTQNPIIEEDINN